MSSHPATISVIIPTYKHAQYILDALNSVFAQTFAPSEIIVINDGSPDNTAEVLQPLILAQRIKYIHQDNQGQAKARNKGIEASSGDYIALLDDDDLWPPDKLEHQLRSLENIPDAVLSYGDVSPFNNPSDLPAGLTLDHPPPTQPLAPSGNVFRQFMRRNWIVSPGQTLIKRAALLAVNGFDTTIWGCDDYDLYIRLSTKGRFIYTNQTALFYRRHAANASRNIELMYRNHRAVRAKNFGSFPWLTSPVLWMSAHWHSRRYFFERFSAEARSLIKEGEFSRAQPLLSRALQIYPTGLFRRSLLKAVCVAFFNKRENPRNKA